MILTQFSWVATFLLFLLSSGFLSANDEAFLMNFEGATQKIKTASKASPLSSEDPTLSAFEKQRDEALKKAQEGKATLAQQAQEMADLMALLNPTPKPKPSVDPAPPPATPKLTPASAPIPQTPPPVVNDIAIPEIARGYEEVYRRFLGGKLIYTDPTSKAKREMPIRALDNPLEGTFDLSGCGDTGQYLSIATGYRKGLKAENASKVEIWLAPWFLVRKNISSSAKHLQPIMRNWDAAAAPVGLFWTWGGSCNEYFDYLVTNSLDVLGSEDLREKYKKSGARRFGRDGRARGPDFACFQVLFLN